MSWSTHRQVAYLGGLFLFGALVLFVIFYPVIFKKPTCFDGKQNGDEVGVDCGGLCTKMCMSQVSEPLVLWSRAFHISGSTYALFAYVENQNKTANTQSAPYEFSVYDEKGILIGTKKGTTFITPNGHIGVFEPRFDAGSSIPKSVVFSFTGESAWYTKYPIIQSLPIKIDKILLGEDKSSPSLSARVVNDSIYDLPAFDVLSIIYNTEHNAIAVSKTHKQMLPSGQNTDVVFTWPEAFSDTPAAKEVFLQVDPFTTPF